MQYIPAPVTAAVDAFTECPMGTPLNERLKAYAYAVRVAARFRHHPDAALISRYVRGRAQNVITCLPETSVDIVFSACTKIVRLNNLLLRE